MHTAGEKLSVATSCSPFFVVGPMRSGTTLLRLMLASHPNIAIPPESHFLPELAEFEQDSGGLDQNRTKVIDWLISHRRLADFKLEPGWMRTALSSLRPFTSRSIACLLFSEYARREGKSRWGDKTPRYRCHISQLSRVFPEAKFIHVVRDGRDTALSAWRAPFGPRTWAEAVYEWRNAVRYAWEGNKTLRPGYFYEVHYERLLLNPEDVLKEICAFLGEEYNVEMMRFSEIASKEVPEWESGWHAKLKGRLDLNNIDKWKTGLSLEQRLLFDRVAGKELEQAGYSREVLSAGFVAHAQCSLMIVHHMVKQSTALVKGVVSAKGPFDRSAEG